jgi:integrase
MLMALYTGARINEIATLELDDFVMEGDVRCIRITHTPKAAKATIHLPSNSPIKRTKNKSSQRLVPLSPQLIALGLDSYLDDLRTLGFTRLFPTLPKDQNGQRKAKLSEDGNRYLKEIGVHVVRTKVLHSFRDTMEGVLGHSGMDEVRVDQWMGRKPKTIKGRHYRALSTVSEQAETAFPQLKFAFIDEETLRYPKGKWNETLREKQKP